SGKASKLFCYNLLCSLQIKGKISVHSLKLAVLFLQFLDAFQLAALKATVSLTPFVKGGRTDTVFTSDFLNAFACLKFLKDLTAVFWFESFSLHNTLLKLLIIFLLSNSLFLGEAYSFARSGLTNIDWDVNNRFEHF